MSERTRPTETQIQMALERTDGPTTIATMDWQAGTLTIQKAGGTVVLNGEDVECITAWLDLIQAIYKDVVQRQRRAAKGRAA